MTDTGELPGLVDVYLNNAVRTSAGPGPGVRRLPRAEAAALVAAKMGVSGDRPPPSYTGSGDGLRH